jgi:hypothetical protein
VLNLKGQKKSRILQPVQAYSHLYYNCDDKIKSTIAERWAEHVVAHPEDANMQGPPLPFRNKILKELYSEETDEVKARVEKCRKEGFPPDSNPDDSDDPDSDPKSDGDSDVDEEEVDRREQAEAYQRCDCMSPK